MPQISLNAIVIDGSTQFRAEAISSEYVKSLASAYAEPDNKIPAVRLFSDGNKFWCGDGHQRIAGKKLAGHDAIDAIVKDGGKEAAIAWALGANDDNGERRTNMTRRKCVTYALLMPEHKDKTDRAIAEICRVSHGLVGDVRKEMEPSNGQSTAERAKRKGRDGKTYPADKTPSDADENPASVVCKRCERIGPVKGCPQCQKLREAAGAKAKKARSKAGKVVYDWKSADAAIGPVYREPVALKKAYSKYPQWAEVYAKYVKEMERMLDEMSNLRRDAKKALLKLGD